MKRVRTLPILCMLVSAMAPCSAHSNSVIIGPNMMGVDQIDDVRQQTLTKQLQDNGVKVIRTSLGGHGDLYTKFVIEAYKHGIGSVVLVSPFANNTAKHAQVTTGSAKPALQDADTEGFSEWFIPELAKLETAGVRVVAFEAGNEINSSPFNADFTAPSSGRMLRLSDLNNPNDTEGRAVAVGYLAYVKILARLKELRDRSQLNKTTPILSGTSAWWGVPNQPHYTNMSGVEMNDSLEFLRQHGLDKLVDGYAVHLYSSSDPHKNHAERVAFLASGFAECRHDTKPCWVTEWAYNNANRSCPIDDSLRLRLVRDERSAYREFAGRGQLAALMYYSWSGDYYGQKESPGTLFRCGALTDAGKLALSPL
jgi:hypothetical protein